MDNLHRKNIGFPEPLHHELKVAAANSKVSILELAEALLTNGLERLKRGELSIETGVHILDPQSLEAGE